MSHFNDNIRLIRALTKKTQGEFARLIKSNTSNVKTWETTDTVPKLKALLPIARFAGVTPHDLEHKKLTEKDIRITDPENMESVLAVLDDHSEYFENILVSLNALSERFALMETKLGVKKAEIKSDSSVDSTRGQGKIKEMNASVNRGKNDGKGK